MLYYHYIHMNIKKRPVRKDLQATTFFWCRRPDLNRHVITDNRFWVYRVCRFRHGGFDSVFIVSTFRKENKTNWKIAFIYIWKKKSPTDKLNAVWKSRQENVRLNACFVGLKMHLVIKKAWNNKRFAYKMTIKNATKRNC